VQWWRLSSVLAQGMVRVRELTMYKLSEAVEGWIGALRPNDHAVSKHSKVR
jgi:hypothetical protein